MRRMLVLLTVVAMMVAMMVVMAGTASAQATFTPVSCGQPTPEPRVGTILQVPTTHSRHGSFVCTGRPFNP
jgi:hypothetical protein